MNKLLWHTYYFIVFVSLVILSIGTYLIWTNILDEEKTKLVYINKMVVSASQSRMKKDEELFYSIGQQLINIGMFSEQEKSTKLINDFLKRNPNLAKISIANLNGEIIIKSLNNFASNNENLSLRKETANSFQAALKSNHLEMGDTYYINGINEWVVPAQYRIVNKSQEVVAVFSTDIKLSSKFNPWESVNLDNNLLIVVVKPNYGYQYISIKDQAFLFDKYNNPITVDFIDKYSKKLLNITGHTYQDMLLGKVKKTLILLYERPVTKESLLSSIYHDAKYGQTILIISKVSDLYPQIWLPFYWLLSLLVAFNLILFFIFRYISKVQETSKMDLAYMAQHDQLTGMYNLHYLTNLNNLWEKNLEGAFSLLFINIDGFKSFNDLHGHIVGDQVLIETSKLIEGFFTNCLCIRQSSDEFLVVLPESVDKHSINKCHKFLRYLKKPFKIGDLEFSLRASIGISRSSVDGTNINNLLRKADIAMYEAKQHKSGVHIFLKELETENAKIAIIAKELNNALERKEMRLVYQPQIEYKTNKLLGVEALLRWDSLILGEVPPDKFIPIAESTGAIFEIGKFVIETALTEFHEVTQQLRTQHNRSEEELRLSINISIRQLTDAGFLDMLFETISPFDCVNTKLMLEITETIIVDKVEELRFMLEKIQLAGIEISLDDFGTERASLSHLSQLPINELKIDKSFVQNFHDNNQDAILIKSIINLGNSLGLEVLAEGVESIEQVEALYLFGCKYFQGYYYSPPLPKNHLLEFMLRGQ